MNLRKTVNLRNTDEHERNASELNGRKKRQILNSAKQINTKRRNSKYKLINEGIRVNLRNTDAHIETQVNSKEEKRHTMTNMKHMSKLTNKQ